MGESYTKIRESFRDIGVGADEMGLNCHLYYEPFSSENTALQVNALLFYFSRIGESHVGNNRSLLVNAKARVTTSAGSRTLPLQPHPTRYHHPRVLLRKMTRQTIRG